MGEGMHLIRMELENFKSFGGEITIPLEEGFTAITGPNGSGKSNTLDALEFVLGPKSTKSLRAANVTQLIFNGGERGRPAKHMSATLVFNNEPDENGRRRLRVDSDEASFTRTVKLGRKGAPISAFRIGDKPSSATEMRRVLAEAGLRAGGYNIVKQGDVTNLATMTAYNRRKIIEDVAGVTAYDDEIRKSNTQRKHVDNSIETIGILEDDQKSRLKGLSKEREQALKFKQLKDELDDHRVVLQQSRHRNRSEDVELLREERSRYMTDVDDIGSKITDGNKSLLELDEEMVRVESEINEIMGGDAKQLLETIRQYEIEMETGGDRISDQQTVIDSSNSEAEEFSKELDRAQRAQADANTSLETAQQNLVDSQTATEEASSEEAEARQAIESGDKHGRDLKRSLGRVSEKVDKAQAVYAEKRLQADRAEQSEQISSSKLADLEEMFEEATMVRDDLELVGEDLQSDNPEEDRTSLAEELRRLQKQESGLVADRDRAEAKVRDSERELSRARARQEERTKAPGSAITLAALARLRQSGEIKGILGSLGELTAPKDDSHEEALAVALGGGLRSIVVNDDDVAAKCITWLRKNGGGRATFLPLNKLSINRPGGRSLIVANNPGVVGFVHDLLEYDPEIDTAVRYVSRNTLVVDSMEVARRNMGGVRMVTLDSSLIESSGAMTGGSSSKRASNAFGGGSVSNSLDRLESTVEDANLVYSTVEAALRELRSNQQTLRDRIHGLDDSDKVLQARNWKSDMDRAQKEVEEVRKKVQTAITDFKNFEKANSEAKEAAADAREALDSVLEERAQAAQALQDHAPDHLSKKLRDAERKMTEAERQRLAAEAAISSSNERIGILTERVEDISKQIERELSLVLQAESRIAELEASITEATEKLHDLREQASQFDEEQKALNERRDDIVVERASLKASLENLSQRRETLSARIEELNGQIQQKREAVDEIVAELAAAGIQIPLPGVDLPTVAEAEKSVQGLDRRLGQLGDVNMLAIEQYDITAERIAALAKDAKLLRSRRDQLISLSEQLESERKTRLLAVFNHVDKNFSKVYEILQPGGSGSLRMENPKNPFEGGLEMDCVPPGKSKNTRRSMLSGGEKSMAALALIFALQDYEPSPFYYLDEVDQNLDPFNAERIATLCRMRSQRAQFLMVTLRKVTLTLADHHVGVTHAGDGRSRLITDFDRATALEMGEQFEAERKAQEESLADKESMPELPNPENMPRAPEPLGTPKSLGGLADRAGVEIEEGEESDVEVPDAETIDSLRERTEDWTEDMEEKESVMVEDSETESEQSEELQKEVET
ncbi:MAG: chromosome segregation protein SMC [Candidatus Thalassarchaeum sp.]